jgi:hypothetical protein
MKSIEEQIKVIQATKSSLKLAFAERTGADVGKVTDPQAIHEIECLESTEKILQDIHSKTGK